MFNEKKIIEIMEALAELGSTNSRRAIFTSEAEFQHNFAWMAKTLNEEIDYVLFETPLDDDKRRVDLVLVMKDGTNIPIEFKYFTKKIDGEEFKYIRNQNDTYRSYDYLADIQRIEEFVSNDKNNSPCGYSIVLTNNSVYWTYNSESETANYKDFRLFEGRLIEKDQLLMWIDSNARGVKKTQQKPIILRKDYLFKWYDYIKENNKYHFKYMINKYIK